MSWTQAWGLGKWIYNTSKKMAYISEGQLIAKTMTTTQKLLAKVFPAEFAARNTGHQINYIANPSITCNNFISKIVPAPSATVETAICNKWNFNTLETMRYFVNGTWFGT